MKHTVINFDGMLETVNKDGRIHEYCIDEMQVYQNYLHYKRSYVNHPYHQSVEYHLFPKENIGIYALTQKPNAIFNKSDTYKFYVDMVKVDRYKDHWISKDLYLDFIIKCDNKHYVVDVDEFRDAITAAELSAEEVACALTGLDNVLKGYYKSFEINEFIHSLIEIYSKEEILFVHDKGRLNYGT